MAIPLKLHLSITRAFPITDHINDKHIYLRIASQRKTPHQNAQRNTRFTHQILLVDFLSQLVVDVVVVVLSRAGAHEHEVDLAGAVLEVLVGQILWKRRHVTGLRVERGGWRETETVRAQTSVQ